ncbi:alpha/beta fold hydrolase [Natronorubrum sp. FCH18a]|uniref:alpha/beta fold hydrolase n=1 Tax=Natronorubrum sp. FCH18a TaxID=3447018 RepID=UPI003F513CEB
MDSYSVTGADDVSLRVDATGDPDSRPIVFVHGYSQSRLCWRPQFDSELADDFRLVAFDIRGHGDSDKPRDAYDDPTHWADDVQAVVDTLERDDPVIVGWSYGGLIVSDYIAVHGTDDLAGAIYVGAISEKGTDDAARFAGESFVELAEGFQSNDVEESVAALSTFIELCVSERLDPDDHHFMLGYNVKTPPHVREALQAREVVNEDTLREVDVPVLLAHGEADSVVSPAAAEKHAELIPNAEASIYPDVGHTPFWEAPDRFEAELRSFVDRL